VGMEAGGLQAYETARHAGHMESSAEEEKEFIDGRLFSLVGSIQGGWGVPNHYVRLFQSTPVQRTAAHAPPHVRP